jgi:uncharacterized membrane protein YkoI
MNVKRVTLLALCLSASAAAASLGAGSVDRRVAVAGPAVSMDQAVKMVEQRYHARVVKAQTENDNGRTLYLLRLLDDSGKVWTVRVDAASGSVL